MITDPKTIPAGRFWRRLYAVGIALVAVLLIAPRTTEFATKVAVLGALALVYEPGPSPRCSRRGGSAAPGRPGACSAGALALTGAVAFRGAGCPCGDPRPHRHGLPRAVRPLRRGAAGGRDRQESKGVSTEEPTGRRPLRIAGDLVAGLTEAESVGQARPGSGCRGGGGPTARCVVAADGCGRERGRRPRLQRRASGADAGTGRQAVSAARGRDARRDDGAHHVLGLAARDGAGGRPDRVQAGRSVLELQGDRYLIVGSPRRTPVAAPPAAVSTGEGLGGVRLVDVARHVGLDFRHGAFRFETSPDPVEMMGGGVGLIDYDGDGWLDVYAVKSASSRRRPRGRRPPPALPQRRRHLRGREPRLGRPGSGGGYGHGRGRLRQRRPPRPLRHPLASYALYRNEGTGTFEDADRGGPGRRPRLARPRPPSPTSTATATSTSTSATTSPGTRTRRSAGVPIPKTQQRASGAPRLPGADHLLPQRRRPVRRRDGRGRHRRPRRPGLGVVADLDDDRRVDLYVANDMTANFPVPQRGGFRFEETAVAAGVAANAERRLPGGDGRGLRRPRRRRPARPGRDQLLQNESTTLLFLNRGKLATFNDAYGPGRPWPAGSCFGDRPARRQQRRPAGRGDGQRPQSVRNAEVIENALFKQTAQLFQGPATRRSTR